MPKIAVDDDVLEGLVKAARLIVELTAKGAVPQGSDVAASAYASLERIGSVFLDDGRLGPDVERALLWVGRSHVAAAVEGISDDQVVSMLNDDWGSLGQDVYDARDALVASLGEQHAPSSPAA